MFLGLGGQDITSPTIHIKVHHNVGGREWSGLYRLRRLGLEIALTHPFNHLDSTANKNYSIKAISWGEGGLIAHAGTRGK